MASQRFRAVIADGPRDRAVIMVPFDPDEAWGAKADHPVSGTIGGCRFRARLVPTGRGWALTLAPKRLIGMGIAIGDEVTVELAPEGPQRGDLADDIAAALAANPAAGAFFDTLRSSTARPTFAGSTRPPAGRICARPALLRSSACSRLESKNGHAREAGCPVRS
jgi:uncharacterized protein DUF1905